MNTIFVTGGSGFIGRHVVSALLKHGYAVRGLVRQGQRLSLEHENLTAVVGDIRDPESLRNAMRECEGVIHVAAVYSLWLANPLEMYAANVVGTRNVLYAALNQGVERIVHTSTVGTISFRKDGLATEADVASPADMTGHYKRSKYEAERIAHRMAAQGAPIVIVNPTAPIGPGDAKPTPTGRIILDFLRGALPAYVDTGLNFVDVRDVAEGHVLALERGRLGERYLLGSSGGNLTLAQFFTLLERVTGTPAPRRRVPTAVASAAAAVDTFLEGSLLRRPPRIPLEGTRMAKKRMWVDSAKAVRELGLPQSPVADAAGDAAEWFVTNRMAVQS